MNSANTKFNNDLNNRTVTCEMVNNDPWLNVNEIKSESNIANHYAKLCQKHEQKNKWILMVNPEEKPLETLSTNEKINTANILRVNGNNKPIKLINIKTALKTGNCSAVILCNTSFKEEEISQLMISAKKGKTQCILLNNQNTLH